MVVHVYNSSTCEAEAGILSLRATFTRQWDPASENKQQNPAAAATLSISGLELSYHTALLLEALKKILSFSSLQR